MSALLEMLNRQSQGFSTADFPKTPQDQNWLRAAVPLARNSNLDFVQRILRRDEAPSLEWGPGTIATHQMSWSTVNDAEGRQQYIVYPTIVRQSPFSQLRALEPREAAEYALRSGEFIAFDSAEEADWFSKNYKAVWGE